jgi:hypothetical protein
MIGSLIASRPDLGIAAGHGLAQPMSLPQLASRFVTADAAPPESAAADADERRRRTRMLLAALATAVLGAVAAAAILLSVTR